jgi:hypothetical protein
MSHDDGGIGRWPLRAMETATQQRILGWKFDEFEHRGLRIITPTRKLRPGGTSGPVDTRPVLQIIFPIVPADAGTSGVGRLATFDAALLWQLRHQLHKIVHRSGARGLGVQVALYAERHDELEHIVAVGRLDK